MKAGKYVMKDGKATLVEAGTQVGEQGSRPYDSRGEPLYERPHECEVRLAAETESKTQKAINKKTVKEKT